MRTYTVKAEKGRVSRVFHEGRELGLLRFRNWYSMSSDLEIGYKKFSVKSTGFWIPKINILENDTELMSYRMDWKGMVIHRGNKIYRLRAAGMFSRKFILTENGNSLPLLTITYKATWRPMAENFEIESSSDFEVLENKELFLLVTLSAVKYYLMLIASAAA